VVELEDLVARHDYRLKPLLTKKCTCGRRNLNLLRDKGTIMSICDSCRKTYPINRECSYCHTIYEYDDLECKVCDVELTKLTEAEISVEDNQKLVRRSKRKLKDGKITKKEYNDIFKKAEDEIIVCGEKARKIRERRQIERYLETRTQKR
jgi:uncharacterized Zn ribbon protein